VLGRALIALSLVLATPAFAAERSHDAKDNDPLRTAGHEGQAFGRTLQRAFVEPRVREGEGEREAGVVVLEGAGEIDVNRLVPGAGSPATTASMTALAGDEEALRDAARAHAGAVANDPSSPGAAYRAILSQRRLSVNELVREQAKADRGLWEQTEAVFAGIDELSRDFADCTAEVTYVAGSDSSAAGVVHEETCEELNVLDRAERVRDISARDFTAVLFEQDVSISTEHVESGVIESGSIGSADGLVVAANLSLS
jgi:hypothetical protein